MKREEVMAIISSMEMQLAELKKLVTAEEVIEVPSTEGLPGSDYDLDAKRFTSDGRELLPNPPAEVHIDIPEDNTPDEDAILGCKIITDLGIDYSGVCSVIKMHKLYFDNGQPKLYINKYKVVIVLCNSKMEVIKTVTTHWNNLAKFHTELIARGINTHSKENWMPRTILLDLE